MGHIDLRIGLSKVMIDDNSYELDSLDYLHDASFVLFGEGQIFNEDRRVKPAQDVQRRKMLFEELDIGLSMILGQIDKRYAREGMIFNLMVAGRSGVGKTTFINSLFETELIPPTQHQEHGSLPLEKYHFLLQNYDGSVNLKLQIVDTPGYANKINNNYCWVPLINYLDEQMTRYVFQEEQPYREEEKRDSRVHCCLYFIEACDTQLHPIDIISMRELSSRCNLIPVLSKSDYLTEAELTAVKQRVKDVIRLQNIKICRFFQSRDKTKEVYGNVPYCVKIQSMVYHWQKNVIRPLEFKTSFDKLQFNELRDLIFGETCTEFVESTETYYERCRQYLLEYRIKNVRDDVENNTDLRGLQEYLLYHSVAKSRVDEEMTVFTNPTYLDKVSALKQKYTERLIAEDGVFDKWVERLARTQKNFNLEIKNLQSQINAIKETTKVRSTSNATLVQEM